MGGTIALGFGAGFAAGLGAGLEAGLAAAFAGALIGVFAIRSSLSRFGDDAPYFLQRHR